VFVDAKEAGWLRQKKSTKPEGLVLKMHRKNLAGVYIVLSCRDLETLNWLPRQD
jgi:hypothetical protein